MKGRIFGGKLQDRFGKFSNAGWRAVLWAGNDPGAQTVRPVALEWPAFKPL
jgi:hypothetical protein